MPTPACYGFPGQSRSTCVGLCTLILAVPLLSLCPLQVASLDPMYLLSGSKALPPNTDYTLLVPADGCDLATLRSRCLGACPLPWVPRPRSRGGPQCALTASPSIRRIFAKWSLASFDCVMRRCCGVVLWRVGAGAGAGSSASASDSAAVVTPESEYKFPTRCFFFTSRAFQLGLAQVGSMAPGTASRGHSRESQRRWWSCGCC